MTGLIDAIKNRTVGVISRPPAITPDLIAAHSASAPTNTRRCSNSSAARRASPSSASSRDVVGALLLQILAVRLRKLPTKAPWVIHGPGENAGVVDIGDGLAADLQDGEPQPPELHRALPGRGDRRRRHPARRLHHGRAADRQPERAALRQPGQSADRATSSTAWCAASAATATASACPRSAARSISTAAMTATRWSTR